MTDPHFHRYGDRALLLQWDQRIDPEINRKVIHLNDRIAREGIPGIALQIPAYCSLTIGFDPGQITYEQLCERITAIMADTTEGKIDQEPLRQISVPVCYIGHFAPDLPWLSDHVGLTVEQIIQLHTGTTFRVYMLGFMPGFPYLGLLPSVLEAPRKTTPRLRVPAGSVALAGLQTGIYPIESPGGWQIIGRTPWRVFDPERAEPFMFRPGDEVRFVAIEEEEFERIQQDAL